jgi:hypothetical protein
MFSNLLFFHSIFRWLLLIVLVYSIIKAYNGYVSNLVFSKIDNAFRHWTATIAHIQLMIGITLFFKSEIVKYFWNNIAVASQHLDTLFFGIIHILLMILSVIILTIGSAMAKRKMTDKDKFKTMFIWFLIALFIIFIAIPWPFSPLANRPYFRHF